MVISWFSVTDINSVTDLANQKQVKYGTVSNSAVEKFFAEQSSDTFSKMNSFMQSESTWVHSVKEGIKLVNDSYGKPKSERINSAYIPPLYFFAAFPCCFS